MGHNAVFAAVQLPRDPFEYNREEGEPPKRGPARLQTVMDILDAAISELEYLLYGAAGDDTTLVLAGITLSTAA